MSKARVSSISIKELATLTGLSTATVSRALRPETQHLVRANRREKVLEVAAQMGYVPHPGSRSLRHLPELINVLLPPLTNIFSSEYYGGLLSGVLEACVNRRLELRIAVVDVTAANYLQNVRTVALAGGGLFYLGDTLTEEQLAGLESVGRPLVLIVNSLPFSISTHKDTHVPVVGIDNKAGARAMAQYLVDLGHRRIAIVNGEPIHREAHDRKKGFLSVLRKHNLPLPEGYLFEGDYTIGSGKLAWQQLRRLDPRPTAILCGDDDLAIGCTFGIREDGLRCPEDISIVGFDDIRLAEYLEPPLTTMHQPVKEIAFRGVDILHRLIRGEDLPAADRSNAIFTPELVIRKSCAAPPTPKTYS